MKRTRRASNAGSGSRSLKSTAAFEAFVVDQLADLGDVITRKMFGGVGLYLDGLFFGLIARDVLYLKVDDENRREFEAAGSRAFRPFPDRPGSMNYYEVPLNVLESAPDLVRWARRSVRAASVSARGRGSDD